MNILGYSQLNEKKKEILHASLDLEGIRVNRTDVVDANPLGVAFNW